MGTTDYTANPTPVTLAAGLNDSLGMHVPELDLPTFEELLEDQLETGPAASNETSVLGPVDYIRDRNQPFD